MTNGKKSKRRWRNRKRLLDGDTVKNCDKLRDKIRKGLLKETELKNRATAEAIATEAAQLLVASQLQYERSTAGGLTGDAARALPALSSNAKRLLDMLGVAGPTLEDEDDEL